MKKCRAAGWVRAVVAGAAVPSRLGLRFLQRRHRIRVLEDDGAERLLPEPAHEWVVLTAWPRSDVATHGEKTGQEMLGVRRPNVAAR